jgi:hypothetical protein
MDGIRRVAPRLRRSMAGNANFDVHGVYFYLQTIGTTSNGAGNGSPGQIASAVYSNDTISCWGCE